MEPTPFRSLFDALNVHSAGVHVLSSDGESNTPEWKDDRRRLMLSSHIPKVLSATLPATTQGPCPCPLESIHRLSRCRYRFRLTSPRETSLGAVGKRSPLISVFEVQSQENIGPQGPNVPGGGAPTPVSTRRGFDGMAPRSAGLNPNIMIRGQGNFTHFAVRRVPRRLPRWQVWSVM